MRVRISSRNQDVTDVFLRFETESVLRSLTSKYKKYGVEDKEFGYFRHKGGKVLNTRK